MVEPNPKVFIAVEVEYDNQKYPHATDLTSYFNNPSNGGGEVLATLTNFQGDCTKAVVIFDPDCCDEDIATDLRDRQTDPSFKISEHKVLRILDETSTYLSHAIEKKLLKSFEYTNLRKRVQYQCAFQLQQCGNPKRIKLEGNFSHVKLAEECLRQIVSDAEKQEKEVGSMPVDDNVNLGSTPDVKPKSTTKVERISTADKISKDNTNTPDLLGDPANKVDTGDPVPLTNGINSFEVDTDDLTEAIETGQHQTGSEPERDPTSLSGARDKEQANGDSHTEEMVQITDFFDRIFFEFMEIECRDDYKKIIDKHSKCKLSAKEDDKNVNNMIIEIKAPSQAKAQKMLDDVEKMFQDTYRQLTATVIKLSRSYTGDPEGIRQSLKRLKGRRLVARLVTNEDIRIVGFPLDIERNINIVEDYVEEYMNSHPECAVPLTPLQAIKFRGVNIRVEYTDLLRIQCDAVISSATPNLDNTTPVARAISDACGQAFDQERRRLSGQGPLAVTDVCSQDTEGRLRQRNIKYVIHAVGPWDYKQDYKQDLTHTITNALKEAKHLKCSVVALPAIGSGTFGVKVCAEAYWEGIENFLYNNTRHSFTDIVFACQDRDCARTIHETLSDISSELGRAASANFPTSPARAASLTAPGGAQRVLSAQSGGQEPSHNMSGSSGSKSGAHGGAYRQPSSNHSQSHRGSSAQIVEPFVLKVTHGGSRGQNRHTGDERLQIGQGGQGYVQQPELYPPSGKPDERRRTKATGGASATGAQSMTDTSADDTENRCPICLEDFDKPKELPCKHKFCKNCLDAVEKTSKSHQCPVCRVPFAVAEGKQPKGGRMTTTKSHISLPGYHGCGTLVINYNIPGGIQGHEHPSPGIPYSGTSRSAYLPNNSKGQLVERLLRKAFDQRLIFTVGTSITTGASNQVVWNDIHHKTSTNGGAQGYGYPDPDYLDRVIDDLKARGIKE